MSFLGFLLSTFFLKGCERRSCRVFNGRANVISRKSSRHFGIEAPPWKCGKCHHFETTLKDFTLMLARLCTNYISMWSAVVCWVLFGDFVLIVKNKIGFLTNFTRRMWLLKNSTKLNDHNLGLYYRFALVDFISLQVLKMSRTFMTKKFASRGKFRNRPKTLPLTILLDPKLLYGNWRWWWECEVHFKIPAPWNIHDITFKHKNHLLRVLLWSQYVTCIYRLKNNDSNTL